MNTEEQTREDIEQVAEESGAESSPDTPPSNPTTELTEAREKLAELNDRLLRTAADFENTKKRLHREREISLKYAEENLLREMLPGIDNLERAMEQARAMDGVETLIEGLEMTLQGLLSTFEKFGATPLNSVGKPFDANIHEALTMENSDDVPAKHVLREFVRGYMYKDRLLRAAKVIVSNGPGEENP